MAAYSWQLLSLTILMVVRHLAPVPDRHAPPDLLLRAGWRANGQGKNRPGATLSKGPPATMDTLRRVRRNETRYGRADICQIGRALPHGPVAAVLGPRRQLPLDRLLDPKASPSRERVLALLAARLLTPSSQRPRPRARCEPPPSPRLPLAWASGPWPRPPGLPPWPGSFPARHALRGAWQRILSTPAPWGGPPCPRGGWQGAPGRWPRRAPHAPDRATSGRLRAGGGATGRGARSRGRGLPAPRQP